MRTGNLISLASTLALGASLLLSGCAVDGTADEPIEQESLGVISFAETAAEVGAPADGEGDAEQDWQRSPDTEAQAEGAEESEVAEPDPQPWAPPDEDDPDNPPPDSPPPESGGDGSGSGSDI